MNINLVGVMNQRVLMRITKLIAESDGSISVEEKRFIDSLPERFGFNEQREMSFTATKNGDFDNMRMCDLASQLVDHGDKCLAVRLACLVAASSRNHGDHSDINSSERSAYRELIEVISLSADELSEIEWSARQEIQKGKPLIKIITDMVIGDLGWPDPTLMGPEIPGL